MFTTKRVLAISLVLFLGVVAVAPAEGAPAWKPTETITGFDIGGTPGSAYDLILRQIATVIPDYLGVRMVVQNLPGGDGLVGMDKLVRSKPDGYTFGIARMPTYVAMALTKPLEVDASELIVPAAILVPPYILMASKKSEVTSLSQLLEAGEKIKMSVSGGSMAAIGLAAFFREKGVEFVVAPAKGTAEAEMSIRGGYANLYIAAGTSVGLRTVTSGDATPILIFDDKRDPRFPDTPCLQDVGMSKDLKNLRAMRMFVFPPGVPEERMEVMRNGLTKAIQDPKTQEWSKKADIPVDLADPATIDKQLKWVSDFLSRYPDLVKRYFF